MADGFTGEVEDAALLQALDRLPDVILARLKPVAKGTADRIATGARQRIRISGRPASAIKNRDGHTRDHIRVEEDVTQHGYVVLTNDPSTRLHVDLYLEKGTVNMSAFPFLDQAAQLEAPGHYQRARDVVQEVIETEGLGGA